MVNLYKLILALGLCALAGACTDSPKPEIPPGATSEQKTRTGTQRLEEEETIAKAVGDSVVHFIEGSFLQLAESQPKAQALFVAQPDKLPAVQVILQRYKARLERRPLTNKEERQWQRSSSLYLGKRAVEATVQEKRFGSALVYQRPIQIKRRNCASCEEPSLLDFMAKDLDQLRVFSAQGKPEGYEVGTVTGMWVIHFPKATLEPITK